MSQYVEHDIQLIEKNIDDYYYAVFVESPDLFLNMIKAYEILYTHMNDTVTTVYHCDCNYGLLELSDYLFPDLDVRSSNYKLEIYNCQEPNKIKSFYRALTKIINDVGMHKVCKFGTKYTYNGLLPPCFLDYNYSFKPKLEILSRIGSTPKIPDEQFDALTKIANYSKNLCPSIDLYNIDAGFSVNSKRENNGYPINLTIKIIAVRRDVLAKEYKNMPTF